MENCLFCLIKKDLEQKLVLSNMYCMFLQKPQEVGKGIRYWLKQPQNNVSGVADKVEKLLHKY